MKSVFTANYAMIRLECHPAHHQIAHPFNIPSSIVHCSFLMQLTHATPWQQHLLLLVLLCSSPGPVMHAPSSHHQQATCAPLTDAAATAQARQAISAHLSNITQLGGAPISASVKDYLLRVSRVAAATEDLMVQGASKREEIKTALQGLLNKGGVNVVLADRLTLLVGYAMWVGHLLCAALDT